MKYFAFSAFSLLVAGTSCVSTTNSELQYQLPIIDAHSQYDERVDTSEIVRLMDSAGVARTILSARGRLRLSDVKAFAEKYPERIVAAVRTKGGFYSRNTPRYYGLLYRQSSMPVFQAMGEVLLWHAQKGRMAEEIIVSPDDRRVTTALDLALRKEWPFIAHIEYAAAGKDGGVFLSKLEELFAANPNHPFLLIHMGQLPFEQVERLIGAHGNIYFLVSHSNSVTVPRSTQPWTNLFAGDVISPQWKALMITHSDRFVLNFDNVFAEHWGDYYLDQVALWRKALAELPSGAAHKIARENAERLWRLPVSR